MASRALPCAELEHKTRDGVFFPEPISPRLTRSGRFRTAYAARRRAGGFHRKGGSMKPQGKSSANPNRARTGLAAVSILAAFAAIASADTYTVTNTDDS